MISFTYQIYILSLLICLLVYTPKLKHIAIKTTNEKYTLEYLNVYGFYVVIVNLYIALVYSMGFVLYNIIGIPLPFNIFSHSDNMLQAVQVAIISNILMLPISWGSYLLYVKCFKETVDTLEDAQKTVEMWAVTYSLCSVALFYMTHEMMLAIPTIVYSEYTAIGRVFKTIASMIAIGVLSIIYNIQKHSIKEKDTSANEHTSTNQYAHVHKYMLYCVGLLASVFFIR